MLIHRSACAFDLRQEPSALAAQAGICAGGIPKGVSLPRQMKKRSAWPASRRSWRRSRTSWVRPRKRRRCCRNDWNTWSRRHRAGRQCWARTSLSRKRRDSGGYLSASDESEPSNCGFRISEYSNAGCGKRHEREARLTGGKGGIFYFGLQIADFGMSQVRKAPTVRIELQNLKASMRTSGIRREK